MADLGHVYELWQTWVTVTSVVRGALRVTVMTRHGLEPWLWLTLGHNGGFESRL